MNIGVSEGPYVLALDIGTSSARALLFDREGELVPGAKEHYSYLIPTRNDGAVEAEPHALCEAVYQCIDGCLEKAGELVNKIQGVGTCAFASSILGIGPNGKPVSPVYTYADSRPQLDVAALRKEMDEDAVQQRTGTRFHTSYLAPRFRCSLPRHPRPVRTRASLPGWAIVP